MCVVCLVVLYRASCVTLGNTRIVCQSSRITEEPHALLVHTQTHVDTRRRFLKVDAMFKARREDGLSFAREQVKTLPWYDKNIDVRKGKLCRVKGKSVGVRTIWVVSRVRTWVDGPLDHLFRIV